MNESPSQGERLSKLEGIVTGLADQISGLIKHQEARDRQQSERDSALFKKLEEARDMSRPNLQTWVAGLGLVAVIVFGVYTPFANGLNEKVSTVLSQSQLADKNQEEKLHKTEADVERLQAVLDERLRLDLQELQARRMKDQNLTSK